MNNFVVLSPLDQFEIRDLISINLNILNNSHISLTNIGLYLIISTILILSLNKLATNYNKFISNLARNISLGLRLAANIVSGHMLLNILSGFTYKIMTSGILFLFVGLIPLAFIIAFSGLELAIAFIQSQVFVVLTCSYIRDSL